MGKKVRLLQKITTQGTLKCESKRGLAVRDGGIWMERVLALVEQEIENPGKPVDPGVNCMHFSALGELGSTTCGFETVLAYSLAPVFLDFMGFLASALKCCPSI